MIKQFFVSVCVGCFLLTLTHPYSNWQWIALPTTIVIFIFLVAKKGDK